MGIQRICLNRTGIGLVALTIFCSVFLQPTLQADAIAPADNGIGVSPVRSNLKIDAGQTKSAYFTVINLSDNPMTVNLSIKDFSVADYTYDYEFQPVHNDWVTFRQPQLQLAPHQSEKVWYDIKVPEKTTPGGNYYSLLASTDIMRPSNVPATVQAATLLYLTVNGDLVQTSILQNGSIPWLVMGNEIPYQFDVKNTGNVHFSAYFYGQVDGLLSSNNQSAVGTSHLLLPGAIRSIKGTVPSPLFPGIYKVTYGYKVDFADIITSKTGYVIYVPAWIFGIALAAMIIVWWFWQRKRRAGNRMAQKRPQ